MKYDFNNLRTRALPLVGIVAAGMLATACSSTLDRLERVGDEPKMASFANPTETAAYKPISWPTPAPRTTGPIAPNSLWQQGAKSFFRDNRARDVGDIVTVVIDINDKATLDNKTERKREGSDRLAAPAVFGLERKLAAVLPGDANPSNLLSTTTAMDSSGEGAIDRAEKVTTRIAAVVTQVLPNGSMVVQGDQEVRINYEVRHVGVQGVVRPTDISNENTISLSQIAEARVSYGGRGQITDVQQPRIGSQIVDILSPF